MVYSLKSYIPLINFEYLTTSTVNKGLICFIISTTFSSLLNSDKGKGVLHTKKIGDRIQTIP